MRIDPKTTTVTPVAPKTVDRTVSTAASERTDEPSAVVSLSRAGAAAVEAKPADSAEKVARLRMMIEKGDYKVDLDVLASKIVDDDLGGVA